VYSGQPDDGRNDDGQSAVDIDSSGKNGSAVLRVITKRADFLDVSVRFRVTNLRLVTTPRTPEKAWNGLHLFLRRQDEDNTYYVDINRRDNALQIKRKRKDAGQDQAMYVPIAERTQFNVPYGVEQRVRVDCWTLARGLVQFRLYINDVMVQQTADASGPSVFPAGAVGIRGDNCEFVIDDFELWSLGDLDR
jgi:hypothetical protein